MEILAKIGFDWQIALANLVNFLIIFYLLKRFLFGPVSKILAERRRVIADGLANATLASDALAEAKKEGDRIVAEARAQANAIISAVEKDGGLLKERRAKEAEAEAAAILSNGRAVLEQERSRLEAEVSLKAVDVAVQGASAILHEEIDGTKHTQLVKKAIGVA